MRRIEPLTVLMPVKSGAEYLAAQIDSLVMQTRPPDRLVISDDGSDDATRAIIKQAERAVPFEVSIVEGPREGYPANIRHLISHAPDGYWAFCDQDDVWLPDRIERGLASLHAATGPALHVVRRMATDAELSSSKPLWMPNSTTFRNALVMNAAPANATILNPLATRLIKAMLPRIRNMPSCPDWWIYALVLGCGGSVNFDPIPGILYRQHGANLFGARRGWGMARRIRWLADGTHLRRVREVVTALDRIGDALTPDNQQILNQAQRIIGDQHAHRQAEKEGSTRKV
ncbi:glycosyltransferase [Pseudooceanicola sp. MF1-13]|uniref:glycosyltransferase n=1 Tax=Pseudooceanicola sp. MF1-13 TaxID=3379095 RepID=UPI003891357B